MGGGGRGRPGIGHMMCLHEGAAQGWRLQAPLFFLASQCCCLLLACTSICGTRAQHGDLVDCPCYILRGSSKKCILSKMQAAQHLWTAPARPSVFAL